MQLKRGINIYLFANSKITYQMTNRFGSLKRNSIVLGYSACMKTDYFRHAQYVILISLSNITVVCCT